MGTAWDQRGGGPGIASGSARSTWRIGVLLVASVVGLASCGGSDTGPTPAGGATAEAVVQAHVAAMVRYDLTAACELFSPTIRAEMAAWDGAEASDYCTAATAEALDLATDAERVRVRSIYGDATITELEGTAPGETWFEVRSGDGSYDEQLQVVEEDGQWWVAEVLSEAMDGTTGEKPPD